MGACASACADDHDRRSSSTDVEPPGLNSSRPPKAGRGFGATTGGGSTATGTADGSPKQRNSPSNGNGAGLEGAGTGGHSPGGANGSGRRDADAAAGAGATAAAAGAADKGSGRKRSSSASSSSDRGGGGAGGAAGDSSAGASANASASGRSGTTAPGSAPLIPAMSSIPPSASALAEEHQKDSVPQAPLRKQGSGNALLTLPGKAPLPAKKYTFLLPETIVESPAMSPNGSRGGSPTHGSGTGAGAAGAHGHGSGPASPTFATNIRFTNAAARTAELMARARELEANGGVGLAVHSLSPTNGDVTDGSGSGRVYVSGMTGLTDAQHSARSGNNSSRRGSTGTITSTTGDGSGVSGSHHPLGLHVRASSGGGGSMELVATPLQPQHTEPGPGGPEDAKEQEAVSSVTPVLSSAPALADSSCAAGAGANANTTASGTDSSTADRSCSDSSSPPTAAHTAVAPPSTAGSTGTRASDKAVGGGAGVDCSPLWRPTHTLLHASTASTTAGSAASSARGSTVSAGSNDAGDARSSAILVGTGAWARAEPPAPGGSFVAGSADQHSRRSSAGPNTVAA